LLLASLLLRPFIPTPTISLYSPLSCSDFFPFFFLLIRLPPRSPLFPYTTLFRSWRHALPGQPSAAHLLARIAGHGEKGVIGVDRSEEHTSELQSRENLVCRLLLEKKKLTTMKKRTSAEQQRTQSAVYRTLTGTDR